MKKFKLLSLLTAAAISASCFAGLAISASAEASEMYADWVLKGRYANNKSGTPDLFAGTDCTLPGGSVTGSKIQDPTISDGLIMPVLYYYRKGDTTGDSTRLGGGVSKSFTTYGGDSYTITPIEQSNPDWFWKSGGGTTYQYPLLLDPKLEENNAESYNLRIIFWANSSASNLKVVSSDLKMTDSKGVKDNNALLPDGATAETLAEYTTSNATTDYKEVTYSDLTGYVSFAFNAQAGLAYVGIEYTPKAEDSKINEDATLIENVDEKYAEFFNEEENVFDHEDGSPITKAFMVELTDLGNHSAFQWILTHDTDGTATIDATLDVEVAEGSPVAFGLILKADIEDTTAVNNLKAVNAVSLVSID